METPAPFFMRAGIVQASSLAGPAPRKNFSSLSPRDWIRDPKFLQAKIASAEAQIKKQRAIVRRLKQELAEAANTPGVTFLRKGD